VKQERALQEHAQRQSKIEGIVERKKSVGKAKKGTETWRASSARRTIGDASPPRKITEDHLSDGETRQSAL
jgi:hypothetical protein